MNYPYSIPSVAQIHPALANNPNIIKFQVLQGVHTSNPVGTPIDPRAAIDAEVFVEVLSKTKSAFPNTITDPIIETAKNRAHVLRGIHASLEFGLEPAVGPIMQPQVNNIHQQQQLGFEQLGHRLAGIEDRLARMEARESRMEAIIANIRMMSYNRHYRPLRPLQKQADGDGHGLALGIIGHANLLEAPEIYQPNAVAGDLPDNWNPNIDEYHHLDILRLVIFYNDDFGIHAGDTLGIRKQKFRDWLTGKE